MHDIKIGTLVDANQFRKTLKKLVGYGFETFSITFWQNMGEWNLESLAKEVKETLEGSGCTISCISLYTNPLVDNERGERGRKEWAKLIDAAEMFGTDLVTGFSGRLIDQPVDESLPIFKEVFTPLVKQAAKKNVRIAFENCDMHGDWKRGDWNMAFTPKAWDMMFEAIPDENLGLQWEPCHQMVQLVDPIPQLRKWAKKIFNVHGKDATIAWDVIREKGIHSGERYVWHRTPGFGDTNWTDIITILRMNGYKGSIDIEGFHDPVYRGELEFTGQVQGLKYLKNCRGGDFVPNLLAD